MTSSNFYKSFNKIYSQNSYLLQRAFVFLFSTVMVALTSKRSDRLKKYGW